MEYWNGGMLVLHRIVSILKPDCPLLPNRLKTNLPFFQHSNILIGAKPLILTLGAENGVY